MLVGTDVVRELVRAQPSERVAGWAKRQASFELSVITLEEIALAFALRPNARVGQWLDAFVNEHCEILDVTAEIARRAGRLRAELGARGRQRTQADMLIAATASEHGLALVTRNVRDFEGCGIALLDPFEAR